VRDRLKSAALGIFSKPHPSTPDEIMYSGLQRLRA